MSIGENILGQQRGNKKGLFEHKDIVEKNESVFSFFNLTSQDVIPLPDDWWRHEEIQRKKRHLVELLRDDFSGIPFWGLKDPRIGKLMEMWIEIMDDLGLSPKIVIPYRHPVEVSRSLVDRDFISFERGLLMWLQYNLSIERLTRRYDRVFVPFDSIIADTAAVIESVESVLDIQFPKNFASIAKDVEEFIDPTLQHQRLSDDPPSAVPTIPINLYSILNSLATQAFVNPMDPDRIYAELKTYTTPFAESVWGMNPPKGSWYNNLERQKREIMFLRERVRDLQNDVAYGKSKRTHS
jgi:hypothetical protein